MRFRDEQHIKEVEKFIASYAHEDMNMSLEEEAKFRVACELELIFDIEMATQTLEYYLTDWIKLKRRQTLDFTDYSLAYNKAVKETIALLEGAEKLVESNGK